MDKPRREEGFSPHFPILLHRLLTQVRFVIMPRQFRIRVYGTQRKNIDPALLAQVVILFGRHLHQQQECRQRQRQGSATRHTGKNKQAGQSPRRPEKPTQAEPEMNDTPQRNSDNGGRAAGGGGAS